MRVALARFLPWVEAGRNRAWRTLMRRRAKTLTRVGLLAAIGLSALAAGAAPGDATSPGAAHRLAPQEWPADAGDFIRQIYADVSRPDGGTPDWDRVRGYFLDRALVVLRTARTATTVFDVDGYLKDFSDFYAAARTAGTLTLTPAANGFTERVVRLKAWEHWDMAHVLVLYEAHIPGSPRPPQQGIDSWLLSRRDGRWWVVACTNDLVTPDHPIPPELTGGR